MKALMLAVLVGLDVTDSLAEMTIRQLRER